MPQTSLRLSILDQSIVRQGGTAAEAIANTLETVKLAEALGYTRFWVSEHHNSTMIAGSSPEILMARLGAITNRIRIGSGGVMLPNHSALKVAEAFRLLETMFPGRVDLGIGRAPGGDRITAALLNPSNSFSEEAYVTQLQHLQAFLTDQAETQYGPILAVPQIDSAPVQWMLGSSSGGSSLMAATLGMGLVIARFISGNAGPEIAQEYRSNFRPSAAFAKPEVMIAISVVCAATEEKAAQLRKLADYSLLQFERGVFEPMGPYEAIAGYSFSTEEQLRIASNSNRIVSGTPEQIKSQLESIAADYGAEEIICTTMTYSQEDRLESFRLLANVFDLERA
jgi:luciferase family oxidoreductase group 1